MDALSPPLRHALDGIEPEALLRRIEAWSRVNSGSGNLAGLAEMAGVIADAAADLPGDARMVDSCPITGIASDGSAVTTTGGRSLLVTVRPGASRRVLLTGHMDTVYPADHPFQTPIWKDGLLQGPGVADMKGGLVVMLAALAAFERTPGADRIGYDVIVNADEEVGSGGSAPLIAERAKGKVAALTFEPALPDGTLAGARPGSGNFSIVVRGRAAHAGRDPQNGRNAVVAAADLALRLAGSASETLTVNPARIDGGGPNNIVPDLAILRVNLRPRASADEKRARTLIDQAVRTAGAAHDVDVVCNGGFARPPKPLDHAATRLFALVRDCGSALGQDIAWRDTGGVCDGNNIAAAGVPVVDTMGVRGGLIHTAGEYLIPESVVERARLSALVMARIAAGALA